MITRKVMTENRAYCCFQGYLQTKNGGLLRTEHRLLLLVILQSKYTSFGFAISNSLINEHQTSKGTKWLDKAWNWENLWPIKNMFGHVCWPSIYFSPWYISSTPLVWSFSVIGQWKESWSALHVPQHATRISLT